MHVKIEEFLFKINIKIDTFFLMHVKNHAELTTLLEKELLPCFLKTSMPIIKQINNVIQCINFELDVYYNHMFPSPYINLFLSVNTGNGDKFDIGYYFFNNYLNKSNVIYLDINLDIIKNNNENYIPPLNIGSNNKTHDLSKLKSHLNILFKSLSINDFYLNFHKKNSQKKHKLIYDNILPLFEQLKENEYYDNLRLNNVVSNSFGHKFGITNIINEKGIFKMVEFRKDLPKNSNPPDHLLLTKIFYNLNNSIEDSFIRGLIYDEFFNSTVINTYLNEGKISLHDMLELQNITEY